MSSSEHPSGPRADEDVLKFLYESKLLSDIQILCKNNMVINAHKCILITQPDFHSRFLCGQMNSKDGEVPEIDFSAHPLDIVDAMVRYIYTGDYYYEDCNYVGEQPEICFHMDVYSLADAHRMPKLKALALKYCYDCDPINECLFLHVVGEVYKRGSNKGDPDLKELILHLAFKGENPLGMDLDDEDREELKKYPEFLLSFFERVFEEGRKVVTW